MGIAPASIAVGDLNGDGRLDVITANSASNTSSVLLGQGNGTFAEKIDFGVGGAPSAVTLADINEDGALDAVVTNASTATIALLLNTRSTGLLGVEPKGVGAVSLGRCFPNTSHGRVSIPFALPAEQSVAVEVLDVSGRRVRTLLNERVQPGAHVLQWDGTLVNGTRARPGVYLYELRAGGDAD